MVEDAHEEGNVELRQAPVRQREDVPDFEIDAVFTKLTREEAGLVDPVLADVEAEAAFRVPPPGLSLAAPFL